MLNYKPFNERVCDLQYRNLLLDIKARGKYVSCQQGVRKKQFLDCLLKFPLENGFPIITERDLMSPIGKKGKFSIFHQALGELFAFLNGARTLKELEAFDCHWWKYWATKEKCEKRGLEPGDNGPGFYGAAWRAFPTAEGKPFDQIRHLIEQIKEHPHLTTHIVTPWIPQYLGRGKNKVQKVTVVPCHGLFMINIEDDDLTLTHYQRSADTPVGLVCNFIQYAALTIMIAQVTGYKAKALHYHIHNAHIYRGEKESEDQMPVVDQMLDVPSERFPTVEIDLSVTDIFEFRQRHFKVTDYYPKLPAQRIWTPV